MTCDIRKLAWEKVEKLPADLSAKYHAILFDFENTYVEFEAWVDVNDEMALALLRIAESARPDESDRAMLRWAMTSSRTVFDPRGD
jgi:uncharacterized protein (DUF608 family)